MSAVPRAFLKNLVSQIGKPAGITRINNDALENLKKIVEKKAHEISEGAVKIAKHAGRNTVKEEDVRMVIVRK